VILSVNVLLWVLTSCQSRKQRREQNRTQTERTELKPAVQGKNQTELELIIQKICRARNEPVNVKNANHTRTPWSGFSPARQIRRLANIYKPLITFLLMHCQPKTWSLFHLQRPDFRLILGFLFTYHRNTM